MTETRRLPGLRFQVASPPWSAALPRTDVAALVGYATAGPFHTPVRVEDMAQFTEIFGGDLPPSSAGGGDAGLLGPTVRAFFRHGGTAAWIVRGGEAPAPIAVRLPGLVSVAQGLSPFRALTRSPGSAFRALRVTTSVVSQALPVSGLTSTPSDQRITLALSPGAPGLTGDLLRVELPPDRDGPRYLLGFVGSASAGIARLDRVFLARERALELREVAAGSQDRAPQPGEVVVSPEGSPMVVVSLTRVPVGFELRVIPFSITEVKPSDSAGWTELHDALQGQALLAARLELALRVTLGAAVYRAAGLGFHPDHPRYVGALPDDAALFGQAPAERHRDWFATLRHPRFPLAGADAGAAVLPLDIGCGWTWSLEQKEDGAATAQNGRVMASGGGGSPLLLGVQALGELPEPALVAVPDAALPALSDPGATTEAGAQGLVMRRALHRALVTLCQARGDLFAVLCVGSDATARELALERDAIAGGAEGEHRESVLSHAMLVHPWVMDRPDAAAGLRPLPAVGHTLGRLAALTLADGPWRSPAGQSLQDVIGLVRAWESPERLLESGASPVHADADGFALADARTLSDDPDLAEVPVRRLLIAIRRLARQLGEEAAFELVSQSSARRLETRLASALSRIQTAGAFRGGAGFRVRVTPGPGEEKNDNCLVAEIAINPARPLRWLTIRLVQTNTGALAMTGA